MYIVEVLPITKSAIKDTLSYFSGKMLPIGSLVSIPIRKKVIKGIILRTKEAVDDKAEIKELPYSLKKLELENEKNFLQEEFMEAAAKVATYHASLLGPILAAIIPKRILENTNELSDLKITEKNNDKNKNQTYREPYLIQSPDDDRFADYKSLIRESFAKKQSVFFCVPTLEDARKALEKLEKGIEEYTFLLDGSLTKKETIFIWNKAIETEHPVLIIGTGMFLSLPRGDIGTIIIEKESSRGYKTITRPFVDIRIFAEYYSKLIGARLILGDSLLRTESIKRFYDHELIEYTPLKWRSIATAEDNLVDMKAYQKIETPGFRIFSDEILETINEIKSDNGHGFIYSARRGLSPQVVCNDCGTIVVCSKCSSPIVLHGGSGAGENFFLCHSCGEKRSAEEKCSLCDSWNLVTLGIGIETVEKEIRAKFKDINLFRIDYDSVKNHKTAEKIIREFYKTPGSILLGTEMALLYLDEQIDYCMVASMDSLFALPDFRGNEKIMNILLKMRSLAQKKFIVQTRCKDEPVFEYALKGNIADFYRNEIREREQFAYPPFTILVKITYQGKREEVIEEMKKLKNFMTPYKLQVFPAFIETVRGKYVMHALIKAEKSTWPEAELVKKLISLPQYFTVKIDPDNLL